MSYLPYGSETFSGWVLATGSSVLAHGAVVAITYGGFVQLVAMAPEPAPRPEYTITLERLDSDTLAGLLERQSTDAEANPDAARDEDPLAPAPDVAALAPDASSSLPEAESETPESVTPETVTPETVAPEALTPEPVASQRVTPETVTPDTVTPETVTPETVTAAEQSTSETVTALDPVAEELAAVDAVVPDASPVAPSDTAVSSPLIAETLAPVSPVAADQMAFAPVARQSLTPQNPAASDPVAVPVQRVLSTARAPLSGTANTSGPEVVSALNTAALPRVARPAAGAAIAAPAPPTAQDLAVGDLIARIRATPSDPCLLALPRRDGAEGIGLELIAATDSAMAQFTSALLTPDDAAIRQTRTLVDPRQCAAIGFLRDNRDYPATRLGIALDAAEVPSGGEISGVLRGVAGRYVVLLIVDNNGVVQDLQRFMSFSGNFARFTVPVTRVGPARDTSQSLIAISTDQPAATIRARDGQLAADVFRDLDEAQGRSAAIGFTTFDVR